MPPQLPQRLQYAPKGEPTAASITPQRPVPTPFSLLHPHSALAALGASEAELRAELAVMLLVGYIPTVAVYRLVREEQRVRASGGAGAM